MQDEKRTKLTQDPQRSKLEDGAARVKLKLERDVMIADKLTAAGAIVEVDEATADELCKPFTAPYPFVGFRDGGGEDEELGKIYRARRVDAA